MIPVVEGAPLQSGVPTVSGSIPIHHLFPANFVIPYRHAVEKSGYQRRPQDLRVNRLVSDLRRKRVDLPTAVLFNIRDFDSSLLSRTATGGLELDLSSRLKSGAALFYVVDGQHRLLALKVLFDEDPERWRNYQIHFVCMLGAPEKEEMRQFYVVNSTAKSVRTDLALDLLKQQADQDSRVMDAAIDRGEQWKIIGQGIVENVAKISPVWKGRIRFPNEPKADTTITTSSFVSSLKGLLSTGIFPRLSEDNQARLIDAYWRAIREVLREPFDDDPQAYSLQKGVGVAAMHALLADVMELVRARGDSLYDPASYTSILDDVLSELEGDTGTGDIAHGAGFWISGEEGAAGAHSSSAGRRVLVAKMRQHLPELEVE